MIASLDNVLLIGILNRLAMDYELGGIIPSSKANNTNMCSIQYDEDNVEKDGTWCIYPIKTYNDMFENVKFQVSFDCDPEYPDESPLVTADIDDDLTVIIEKGKWYV